MVSDKCIVMTIFIVVISTSEEYSVLNELRLEFKSQALVGNCDLMTCVDQEGNEISIYFEVSRLFMKMRE